MADGLKATDSWVGCKERTNKKNAPKASGTMFGSIDLVGRNYEKNYSSFFLPIVKICKSPVFLPEIIHRSYPLDTKECPDAGEAIVQSSLLLATRLSRWRAAWRASMPFLRVHLP